MSRGRHVGRKSFGSITRQMFKTDPDTTTRRFRNILFVNFSTTLEQITACVRD